MVSRRPPIAFQQVSPARSAFSLFHPEDNTIINLRLSWILDHDQKLLFFQLIFQQLSDVKAERVIAASVTASWNSIDKDLDQVEQ